MKESRSIRAEIVDDHAMVHSSLRGALVAAQDINVGREEVQEVHGAASAQEHHSEGIPSLSVLPSD